MKKRLSLLAAAIFVLFINDGRALAQSESYRFDVGGQFTLLRAIVDTFNRDETLLGGGGRFTYNFSDSIAIEGELNYFPENITESFSNKEGRPTKPDYQALFGIKAGRRGDRVGIFGKLRPGFVRFSPLEDCPDNSLSSCRDFRKTRFTYDVGIVIEAYPTSRVVTRFDVGGSYISYGETSFFVPAEPGFPGGIFPRRKFNSFGLQVSAGVGFRF